MRWRETIGRGSLRFIGIAGVGTLIFLLIVAFSLKRVAYKDDSQRATAAAGKGAFNSARAFETLKKVVDLGPRPPGSPEAETLRQLIRGEVEAAGLEVRALPFEVDTPLGNKSMANLVAVVKGSEDGIIALSNHYDTKYFAEFRFVGANDGGSTTAWMIEMARALGPTRDGRTVWLIWFDGEEAFKEWSSTDSLYGSREMVRHLRKTKEFPDLDALINVDMIGDCYLGIFRDAGAPSWLSNAVWKAAAELGHGRHFLAESRIVEDDHMPFRLAGKPAMNLIDYEYGGSQLDHSNTWHTANDTIERVCPASLQAVGDVIYHALPSIERVLDAQARLD